MMNRRMDVLVILWLCGVSAPTALGDRSAELVVLDAKVRTMAVDDGTASAFAVKGGRFVAVGSQREVESWIGPESVVLSCGGRTVTPGFNDAHIHPQPLYAEESQLGRVPCGPDATPSIDALIAALRRKAAQTPAGMWVRGERYEDTKLGRHPTREDLDRASTEHPIYISHSSGHVAAANSLALEQAGITKESVDPRGGRFDRDESGVPNGVLRESAAAIVRNAGPPLPVATKQEKVEGLQRQFREYVSRGITSIQIAGTDRERVDDYRAAQSAGPPVRIYAMLRIGELDEARVLKDSPEGQSDFCKFGAIKHFHGNSLSGQTCWLYEPYADRPDYFGIPPRASQEQLNEVVLRIHQAGLQACIHSNGDREIDMVLNAFENALRQQPRSDHRHRIEHASIVNSEILRRVKENGVVLALHSYVYEHGDKMEAYGVQRWNWMHANRSAMELGIPVAGNSDSPVSKAVPLLRMQSMMTRTSKEGKVYGGQQRVTFEQALWAWTVGSAYASFDESDKGQIAPGQLADFVVLDRDPGEVPSLSVKDIRVALTVIGGTVVFGDVGEFVDANR